MLEYYCIRAAIICADLPAPMNGGIEYSSDAISPYYGFGTSVTVVCEVGYGASDLALRVCGGDDSSTNGVWDGTPATCCGT